MTVLDAFDRADGDDTELAERLDCPQMQVSQMIRTSLERLSAHASMACGGWSMSDPTEGATA